MFGNFGMHNNSNPSIMGSGLNQTYQNQQGSMNVMGSNNTVHLKNSNLTINVMGSNNCIILEDSTAKYLSLMGTQNRVQCRNSNITSYNEQGCNNVIEGGYQTSQPPQPSYLSGVGYSITNTSHVAPRSNPGFGMPISDPVPEHTSQIGLTKQEIDLLPKSTNNCSENGRALRTCSICFEDIRRGNMETFLFCLHSFHTDCIGAWLIKRKHCPECQTDIKRQLQEQMAKQ